MSLYCGVKVKGTCGELEEDETDFKFLPGVEKVFELCL